MPVSKKQEEAMDEFFPVRTYRVRDCHCHEDEYVALWRALAITASVMAFGFAVTTYIALLR